MRTLFLAAVLALSPAVVRADDASHRAAAEELMRTLNVDQMMNTYMKIFDESMKKGFRQAGGTEEYQPIFDKYAAQMTALMQEALSWENFKEPMIDLYVESFSEQEIVEIHGFYQTPVGMKAIAEMPRMMQAGAKIGQDLVQGLMPRIQEISEAMVGELREAKER